MTKNLDKDWFCSIVDNYQLFYIDLWGVIHNGINLHKEAIKVLKEISKKGKEYILLTNAPRPNNIVKSFLEKMGMEKEIREHVFTSGQASLNYLKKNLSTQKFFHVGPPRDFDLFNDFIKMKSDNIDSSEYILCTGLFEKFDKDLNYYKELFKNNLGKQMVCTNPDLIVDRGKKREFCAGSVAKVFEDIGGTVEYFGKPHPKVYNLAANINNKKVFCIGDNLNTDIKGANNQNFASLLITNGIHRQEVENENFEKIMKKYNTKVDYTQSKLKW